MTSAYLPNNELTIEPLDGGSPFSVQVYEKTSDQFAARLRKAFKERRKWAKKAGVFCYRIYDADLPDYAAAIDIYECCGVLPAGLRPAENAQIGSVYLHIAEYQAPKNIDPEKAERRFEDIMTIAPAVCGVPEENVFAKVRCHDKGGQQYAENKPQFRFMTTECGHALEVDLNAYLDTGLFLDHRVTREMVGKLAAGKRMLNLFSYTGSATVHAACGAAASTTTVDLSTTYLEWAKRNMAANGFTGPEHTFERGDTLTWLATAAKEKRLFDLVFVDPPTFSNSKATQNTWEVQRDHVELLKRVGAVLAPEGTIVFSCNLRNFKIEQEQLEALGFEVKDITAQTIPHDFERNPKIHKCFILQKK